MVLTSLKANFNIFYRCHAVVLFMFHKYKPEDMSKIMRALEIKIKWIKRKQMTHENTYRDDIIFIFWTHLAPVLLTVKRDILIVHTRVIFCCSPTMHWSFNTRRRVHSIPGRRRRIVCPLLTTGRWK